MKKLTPKQKKIAAAVAAGGVLALFVLIRGKSGGTATQDATANPATGTGLPADYGAAAGGTFADNGASAGQLTSAVSDLATSLGTGLGQLTETVTGQLSSQSEAIAQANAGFAAQMDALRGSFSQPNAAPGPAGDIGQPAGSAPATPAAAAPRPAATASGPQKTTTGATAKLPSGNTVAVGSIVQKPSAQHGNRMSDFRVNSNGSLTWLRLAR